MIYENIPILINRIGKINNFASRISNAGAKIMAAENALVGTDSLTAKQKNFVLSSLDTMKTEYLAIHTSIVEVFMATEIIHDDTGDE